MVYDLDGIGLQLYGLQYAETAAIRGRPANFQVECSEAMIITEYYALRETLDSNFLKSGWKYSV